VNISGTIKSYVYYTLSSSIVDTNEHVLSLRSYVIYFAVTFITSTMLPSSTLAATLQLVSFLAEFITTKMLYFSHKRSLKDRIGPFIAF
jgi:Mn2+/Fe2+ NRAMP family transporter